MEALSFETLLSKIDEENLLTLQKFRTRGWRVHYVVDADIVGQYCFPNGIRYKRIVADRMQLRWEYTADEQVTLFNLFETLLPVPQGLILNEYLLELKGMTRVALAAQSDANSNASQFYADWLQYTTSNRPALNADELVEDIQHRFSLRVADLLFGIKGLDKFQSLIGDKKIIFESDTTIPSYVRKILESEKGDQKETDFIHREIQHIRSESGSGASRRDAQAIQRIFAINRRLQTLEDPEQRQVLFVFITNPSSSTLLTFKRLQKHASFPEVDKTKLPLFITPHELFAQLISRVIDPHGEEDALATFQNIKNLTSLSKRINKNSENVTRFILGEAAKNETLDLLTGEYEGFFGRYKEIRNTFENTGLFESTNHIYDRLITRFKKRDTNWIKDYFETIGKQQSEISKKLKDRVKLLDTLQREYEFNSAFIVGIEEAKKNNRPFSWQKGLDPIEGSYQILPVFISARLYANFKSEIRRIIRMIMKQDPQTDTDSVIVQLNEMLEVLKAERFDPGIAFSHRILKAIIFLVLPDFSDALYAAKAIGMEKGRDFFVLSWLNLLTEDGEETSEFLSDFLYIRCWLERRVGEYSRSESTAQNASIRYPSDPRFFHGIALARYCKMKEENLLTIEGLTVVIQYIEKCEPLYQEFLLTNYPADMVDFFEKIKSANHNSICDFLSTLAILYVERGDLANGSHAVNTARTRLDTLKSGTHHAAEFPEFFDTESMVEYAESFFLDADSAVRKLNFALEANNRARLLCTNASSLNEYRRNEERISMRLTQLQGS